MSESLSHAEYTLAAQQALMAFPLTGAQLRLVCVSENVTFKVTDLAGDEYALRLHRPGYNSLAELESERLWSAALDRSGIEVQRAQPSSDGNSFAEVAIGAAGIRHYVGVTRWLPGVLLRDEQATMSDETRRAAFQSVGRLTARMHNQASAWSLPTCFTRPHLDCAGLLGEAPRWGRFWEHAALSESDRSLLLRVRERLAVTLARYGCSKENYGLIHADLHFGNLLLTGQGLGVIDFDDAAFGWFVYDLAVALIEHQADPDFPALKAAMLRGYRSARPLETCDEAMLPVFLLLRGMASVGWFHQRPEHTDSQEFEETLERVLIDGHRLVDNLRQ